MPPTNTPRSPNRGHRATPRKGRPTPAPDALYDQTILLIACRYGEWEEARDIWLELDDQARARKAQIELDRIEWVMSLLRERLIERFQVQYWLDKAYTVERIMFEAESIFLATQRQAQLALAAARTARDLEARSQGVSHERDASITEEDGVVTFVMDPAAPTLLRGRFIASIQERAALPKAEKTEKTDRQ